jgi:general secretion pathway protein D
MTPFMRHPRPNATRSVSFELRLFPLLLAASMALSSCAGDQLIPALDPMKVNRKPGAEVKREVVAANTAQVRERLTSSDGLATPLGKTLAEPLTSELPPKLSGDNISVNFEGIRLPAFVNTVFGELLKVSFEIESAVQQREQLVTLRVTDGVKPDEFYGIVRQVLGNYGLGVVYQNGVYRIVDSASMKQDIPRIVRSRTLPSMPNDMRPIFYYVPLSAIPGGLMQSWLQQSLKDRISYQTLPGGNGLLMLGKAEDIEAAKQTIEILDQPALAGFRSMRIAPAFWSAERLATQLSEVLTAEGYSVALGGSSSAGIKILPVRALNIIIVFGTDDTVMRHVLEWATELDQPGQTIESKGVFYHPVYNTKAEEIAGVITKLLQGAGSNRQVNPLNAPMLQTGMGTSGVGNPAAAAANAMTGAVVESEKVIVDKSRNALIFQGSAEEYAQFRSLVEQMDRAPLEVMIEAMIAEVTLREGETLGAVLRFDDGVASAVSRSSVKSENGLAVSLIRDMGQFTASIQALADRSRVNILSSPRIVATNGQGASINVGTQVPIITTQQTAPSGTVGGTSSLLQDIQYRSTGVNLTITPTINSNNRVELVVAQEVSEAQANNISDVQSPLILTRSISTTLSLNDSQTALLGGLISENISDAENGIPFLKDIPIIGNAFKTTTKGRNRTELIILLTPYIIESAETAEALRDAFRDQLTGLIPADSKPKPELETTSP